MALSRNSVELAAATFLNRVLTCFGAPTEVLTDQWKEFLGAFEDITAPPLKVIWRRMAWLNGLFRQPSVA